MGFDIASRTDGALPPAGAPPTGPPPRRGSGAMRVVLALVVVGAVALLGVVLANPGAGNPAPAATSAPVHGSHTPEPGSVRAMGPPPGAEGLEGVNWVAVPSPSGGELYAAVATPPGDGPFPVLIVLHGADGLRRSYVELARRFAGQGFLTVAGCWFVSPPDPSRPEPDSITCDRAPPARGADPASAAEAAALVRAAAAVPGADPERVAAFGHSRGAALALVAVAFGVPIDGVVASAGLYAARLGDQTDLLPISLVDDIDVPLLMLHGTNDTITPYDQALAFFDALAARARPVGGHTFDGSGHALPVDVGTSDELVARSVEFLRTLEP